MAVEIDFLGGDVIAGGVEQTLIPRQDHAAADENERTADAARRDPRAAAGTLLFRRGAACLFHAAAGLLRGKKHHGRVVSVLRAPGVKAIHQRRARRAVDAHGVLNGGRRRAAMRAILQKRLDLGRGEDVVFREGREDRVDVFHRRLRRGGRLRARDVDRVAVKAPFERPFAIQRKLRLRGGAVADPERRQDRLRVAHLGFSLLQMRAHVRRARQAFGEPVLRDGLQIRKADVSPVQRDGVFAKLQNAVFLKAVRLDPFVHGVRLARRELAGIKERLHFSVEVQKAVGRGQREAPRVARQDVVEHARPLRGDLNAHQPLLLPIEKRAAHVVLRDAEAAGEGRQVGRAAVGIIAVHQAVKIDLDVVRRGVGHIFFQKHVFDGGGAEHRAAAGESAKRHGIFSDLTGSDLPKRYQIYYNMKCTQRQSVFARRPF